MNRFKIYASKALFFLLSITILLLICTIFHQINGAKEYLADKIPACLNTAVERYVDSKMGGIYYLAQYEYDPNSKEIGGYETRTARYADTTFTYRSKIVTPAESALRDFQTLLVEIEQSYQDSIQVVFDDLLQKENIYAQSIIGITSSFYTKKNEWSGDTLALKPNYRTAFTNQGVYEDINYYAYIHYSSYTIWHLMHKTLIYILFICCLVIGIFLFWWTRKLKKEIANTTEVKKDGNYYIKDLTYYVNEKRLVLKEKEVKLSPQLHELLLMFLKTDRYRVAKIEIRQKFWPKSIDATSNMTSTINRLNKELKEIDCAYTIISDPKNDEYYIFSELPPASPELQ